MLTWWHEEVLFSCRSLAVRNAADWGTRRLVSRGIRFRKRNRSLWQGEWLLLKRIKYSRVIYVWCHYVNLLSTSMHNGRWKWSRNFIWLAKHCRITNSSTRIYNGCHLVKFARIKKIQGTRHSIINPQSYQYNYRQSIKYILMNNAVFFNTFLRNLSV